MQLPCLYFQDMNFWCLFSFCKNTIVVIFQFDVSCSFRGRPTIATNVPRAGDRNPVLRLRQGYGACTLLQAGVLSLSVDSFMLLILNLL